ncbi:ER membrane protein complex subunit 2-like [Camellia sinensis]|uniref:ER membrane protein complex subunit 2-like n=1 Tax=Camellia sinensis TaxID=4442 RepID=UPI0010363DB7|nr:ER membrane protein complex subunit 2-like [Camellia sinensis]
MKDDQILKDNETLIDDPKASQEDLVITQVKARVQSEGLDAMEVVGTKEMTQPAASAKYGFTGRLEAMLLEAKGLWAEAEKAYSSLLEDNPPDHQVIQKRMATTAKAQGNLSGAIEWLNKYLEIFMADHDAWRELAEIYVSLQMYKQAAFCYEELILSQPTNPLYHLAYPDVSGIYFRAFYESFQLVAIIENFPPPCKEFKNYLKHMQKEIKLEFNNKKWNHDGNGPKQGSTSKINKGINNGFNKRFKGKCFVYGKDGHRAKNFHVRKERGSSSKKSAQANIAENFYLSDGVASINLAAVVSKENLVGNPKEWWVDTGAARHICTDKKMFTTYKVVESGE